MAEPVTMALVGSSILGGAAALKSLTAKPPTMGAPKEMPMPDDKAAQAAKRRQMASMQTRSGRASTILSDQADVLGG